MHSKIKINGLIKVHFSLIEKLNPYVDEMKSIQVRHEDDLSQPISLDTIY